MTFLSIIIPAYNEEQRLPDSLEKVLAFTRNQEYRAEVIVVENGSTDRTFDVAQSFIGRFPELRVLHEAGRGKGLAVRRGMLEASGEYRFMCDADLSMPIEELERFLPPALPDVEVAIASREVHGAIRYDEPGYRHWGGRGVNWVIRLLAIPGIHDTQCGFKMYRGDIAEELFGMQTMDGWSFDIEILMLARMKGYLIQEIPVPWYFANDSKVEPLRDSILMIRDILQIRKNASRGIYEVQD